MKYLVAVLVVIGVFLLLLAYYTNRPDAPEQPSPSPAPVEETTVEEPVSPPAEPEEPGVIQYGELPDTGGDCKIIPVKTGGIPIGDCF